MKPILALKILFVTHIVQSYLVDVNNIARRNRAIQQNYVKIPIQAGEMHGNNPNGLLVINSSFSEY